MVGWVLSAPWERQSYIYIHLRAQTVLAYSHHTQTNTQQLIPGQTDRVRIAQHAALDTRRVGIIRHLLLQPTKQLVVVRNAPLADLRRVFRRLGESQPGHDRIDDAQERDVVGQVLGGRPQG